MQSISGETRLFGILGNPVAHSISPTLHNRAFERAEFPGVYVPFLVDETGPFLKKAILHMGLQGVSVTIPHKLWAAKNADQRDQLVELTGAANTLVVRETRRGRILEAHNTDGPGAARAIKTVEPDLSGKTILIEGYGGAARAIAGQLLLHEHPGRIWIAGRNRAKIRSFIRSFEVHNSPTKKKTGGFSFKPGTIAFADPESLDPMSIDIVINTTPLGMKGFDLALPIPDRLLRHGVTVMDIVYVPEITPLLERARANKARIVPGYLMLLHQALLQFELFTGLEAGPELENVMRLALLTKLRS